MMSNAPAAAPLKRTPLYDFHVSLGAKMVPFAGYEMPVQYPTGVLKEHLWTREKCGLFDVSHMGQAALIAEDGRHETVARALEALVPADILNLKPGQQRYSQLLADDGGIIDDLMVARSADPEHDGTLYLVVNAGCKDADYAHVRTRLPQGVILVVFGDKALLALQGPTAAAQFARLVPAAATLAFMTTTEAKIGTMPIIVTRSGYTGEDGYELSVNNEDAVELAHALASPEGAQPIGLGARDSLRLEAGLCLYGHDIDTSTSPIEAGLAWSIQKRRRLEGGFPGAARIQRELRDGPPRMRVGITEIFSDSGDKLGTVTSGGFGPSVNGPIAMGYVTASHAKPGTKLSLMVRGKSLPASVVALPFHPHRYVRK
jgi:aminomethyltransferase